MHSVANSSRLGEAFDIFPSADVIVLPDPFSCDARGVVGSLDDAFPTSAKVGGLASGEAATLTLSGIADGGWRARWIDTIDGTERGSVAVVASGGELTLALPDFVGDLAVRLERE